MNNRVYWCSNIKRKKGIREGIFNGRETYLLDKFPGAMDSMFILSKEFLNREVDKTYYNYTAFDSYPDIYKYLISVNDSERRLHEVIGEFKVQKPRFDIDVDMDKYQKAIKLDLDYESMTIEEMGEYVKDMVISSIITIMKLKDYILDLDKDFMIFTSHGTDSKGKAKRSYHIILNRYFHYGCAQADAFYHECAKVSDDIDLFNLLVDGLIYRRGGSLRMIWSTKVDNVERIKKYTPRFDWKGKPYHHHLDIAIEEDENPSPELQKMFILANSLITFVEECVPMPVFAVRKKAHKDNISLSDEAYKECKEIISNWDVEKIFQIEGSEDGIISLARLSPSYCILCDRVHEKMGTFCYLVQAQLFWHCGHAKRAGIALARVKSIKSNTEIFVEHILGEGQITFQDEDGQVISHGTIKKECNVAPLLTIKGVDYTLGEGQTTTFALRPRFPVGLVKCSIKSTAPIQEKPLPVSIINIPLPPKTISIKMAQDIDLVPEPPEPPKEKEEIKKPEPKPQKRKKSKVKEFRVTNKWSSPPTNKQETVTRTKSCLKNKKDQVFVFA